MKISALQTRGKSTVRLGSWVGEKNGATFCGEPDMGLSRTGPGIERCEKDNENPAPSRFSSRKTYFLLITKQIQQCFELVEMDRSCRVRGLADLPSVAVYPLFTKKAQLFAWD